MKKFSIGILAIGLLLGVAGNSLAMMRGDTTYVRGKVISVDYQRSEVIILEDSSKNEMKFTAKRIYPGVTGGTRVTVIYKVGSNTAKSVRPTKK